MFMLFLIWAVLASIAVALVLLRKYVARNEDEFLHVGDPKASLQQENITRRIDAIDRWGRLVTAAVVVYGVALLCAYLYSGWQETQQVIVK